MYPCSPCVRSSLECVFPARKRTQRQRKSRNGELLQHLSRLESIVAKVDPGALENDGKVAALHGAQPERKIPQPPLEQRKVDLQVAAQGSQADVRRDRYVSAEFWSILSNEMEGIRATLEQDTGSSTEEEPEGLSPAAAQHTSPESSGGSTNLPDPTRTVTSEGVLGHGSSVSPGSLTHPPSEIAWRLVERYFESVDVVLKILHRPSTLVVIRQFLDGSSLEPSQEALMFAMYFGAVTSFNREDCLEALGEERSSLASRYRASVEIALASADYLNAESLECLQAFTIYVVR